MATIKLGTAGGRVAPATTGGRVPAGAFVTPDAGLGDAAQRAATGLVQQERAEEKQRADYVVAKADQLEREQRQEARQQLAKEQQEAERRERELRAARGTSAYTGFHADLDELTDGIIGQLGRGEVRRDELPTIFKKSVDDLKKMRLTGLDAEMQATVTNHMANFERVAAGRVRDAIGADQKREGAAAITGALENIARIGVRDPVNAVKQANVILDAQGPSIFGADKVAVQKQTFAERTWYSHFSTRLTGARNDAKQLQTLETEIAGNETLDPDKKNALIANVKGFQETLAAKAERAHASRIRTLERSLNGLSDVILKGYDVPADQLLPALNAARGTELEPMARQLLGLNSMTAQFRALPGPAQEAQLTALERQVRAAPTKGNIEALEAFRTIANHQRTEIAADPISFAGRKGIADVQPLDLTNPATLGDQLAARLDIAGGMRAKYGAPLQVLTREESGRLAQLLKDAPVESKRTYLGILAGALPEKQAFGTLMQQIAPDDPVTAVAGIFAARGLETNQGRVVADYILRGQAALNPGRKADGSPVGGKVMPMPKDTELASAFASYERDAFAGKENARNAYFQTARAIYAARSLEEGDFSGELHSKRWQSAMELATGGIEKHRGRAIVLPYGYDLSRFRSELHTRAQALVASGQLEEGVGAGQLTGMPLENMGDGRYVFRAGDGVLVGKDKKPVIVDFNQAAAPRGYGQRTDGTAKGKGWLGELKRPDGSVSTELTIEMDDVIGGKPFPLLVPTLTKAEQDKLLSLKDGERAPRAIIDKAVAHAESRVKAGKSPFKD